MYCTIGPQLLFRDQLDLEFLQASAFCLRQYIVNAAYTDPCFEGLANPETIGKYHLYTATGFVCILQCCSLSKPMAQSNTGGMQ